MPRTLDRIEGLLDLRVQRRVSMKPPGDVTSASVLGRSIPEVTRLLDRWGAGRDSMISAVTSEPASKKRAHDD